MKKVISIKQPWAYLIACGLKDIENRTWKTKYRGKILIHTSSKSDNEPYQLFTDEQWDEIEKNQMDPEVFNSYKDLGMIIGEVDIVDCVINHGSIWAEKTHYPLNIGEHPIKPIYNWVLSNPVLYDKPILNVKGKLNLWNYGN